MASKTSHWRPAVGHGTAPIYLRIVDALAADIRAGRLAPGHRLPTHRQLAGALGVNLTTVTRAYNEAHRRGLIDAGVGRGTFVRVPAPPPGGASPADGGPVDLSMNLPPQPDSADLPGAVERGMAALRARRDFLTLLTYGPSAGRAEDRAAGAAWLAPRLGTVAPSRVLVCAGAQAALLALLTATAQRGEVVVTEALTYPGFRALAAHFGIRLRGLAMDAHGILPEALEAACLADRPKALYCTASIQNPTTATMPLRRRQAIVAVARQHGLPIFEDDAYGALPAAPLPPLAALAPDLVFHVAGLAKCLMPALRIAYLVAPDDAAALRLAAAIRATTLAPPPLMAALATQWIGDGTARGILEAIRREAAARQAIARAILPEGGFAAHPEGHHVWLGLPPAWRRTEFDAYLRQMQLAVVPSDAFAVGEAAPEAVRLSLGAARSQAALRAALTRVAEALPRSPAFLSAVV